MEYYNIMCIKQRLFYEAVTFINIIYGQNEHKIE